jgi:hypothetical protein
MEEKKVDFNDLEIGTQYRINWHGNADDKKIVTLNTINRETRQLMVTPEGEEYGFLDSYKNLNLTSLGARPVSTPPTKKRRGGRRKTKKRSRKTRRR